MPLSFPPPKTSQNLRRSLHPKITLLLLRSPSTLLRPCARRLLLLRFSLHHSFLHRPPPPVPNLFVRVLLVEKDDSTREIVAALLRKCGYRGLWQLSSSLLLFGGWISDGNGSFRVVFFTCFVFYLKQLVAGGRGFFYIVCLLVVICCRTDWNEDSKVDLFYLFFLI